MRACRWCSDRSDDIADSSEFATVASSGGTTNALSERVRRLLRCPFCAGTLRSDVDGLECEASGCGARHPLLRGVPVLRDPSRSLLDAPDPSDSASAARGGRLRRAVHRLLPTLERNQAAAQNHARFAALVYEQCVDPLVLNIGGKHASAALKPLWEDPRIDCVQFDVVPGAITNLIGDPCVIPLRSESVDAVIVDAVLEHVADPTAVVSEIGRVLKPGGLVYADTPFMIQVHAGAFDFNRFTHVGHRRLFASFEEIDSGVSQGPGVALAYSLQYFALSFVRRAPPRFAVKALCRLTLFWLKYLDRYLVRQPGAFDAALGFYLIGRKAEAAIADRDVLRVYRGITPDLYPRPRR